MSLMNPKSSPSVLSSVQKACRILSDLSDPGPHRLCNVVANTGLNKATVLRLLDTLIQEGFVLRDPADNGYVLGNEAFVMRAAVARRGHFPECARASLVRLAEASGDAACLSIRCGSQSVCIDREEGAYPLRANYLHIGRRLPLGVGSAGIALLAWLRDEEIDRVMERNRTALARFPRLSTERIRREIRASRARGYALSSNIICEGTGGIAVPILDGEGRPIAALGATALAKRVAARVDMLATHLHNEAVLIQDALRRSPVAGKASAVKKAEHARVRA